MPKYFLHCSTNLILRLCILCSSALHLNVSSFTCLDKRIAFYKTRTRINQYFYEAIVTISLSSSSLLIHYHHLSASNLRADKTLPPCTILKFFIGKTKIVQLKVEHCLCSCKPPSSYPITAVTINTQPITLYLRRSNLSLVDINQRKAVLTLFFF